MSIIIEGFSEKREQLERLLSSNRSFGEDVREVVRQVLRALKKEMEGRASSAMQTDPRRAYKAVRMAAYRQIIGGNVSILQRRAAGSPGSYQPARTLREGQRGGNRRPRSARTEQVDGYMGADRGFILRFLNAGVSDRHTKYGRRGSIAARGWFSSSAPSEMEQAAKTIANLIDDIIEERLN